MFPATLPHAEINFTARNRFGARYYAPSLGRFLTPDWSASPEPVPYANLENPQSLNLYSYVLNNPVSATDPNGHLVQGGDGAAPDSDTGPEAGLGDFGGDGDGGDDGCCDALRRSGELLLAASGGSFAVAGGATVASAGVVDAPVTVPAAAAATVTGIVSGAAGLISIGIADMAELFGRTLAAPVPSSSPGIIINESRAHTKNARPSAKAEHEAGNARRAIDQGRERGDVAREKNGMFQRRRPRGVKGPWPPKPDIDGGSV